MGVMGVMIIMASDGTLGQLGQLGQWPGTRVVGFFQDELGEVVSSTRRVGRVERKVRRGGGKGGKGRRIWERKDSLVFRPRDAGGAFACPRVCSFCSRERPPCALGNTQLTLASPLWSRTPFCRLGLGSTRPCCGKGRGNGRGRGKGRGNGRGRGKGRGNGD